MYDKQMEELGRSFKCKRCGSSSWWHSFVLISTARRITAEFTCKECREFYLVFFLEEQPTKFIIGRRKVCIKGKEGTEKYRQYNGHEMGDEAYPMSRV